ncbi:glyS [Wigglesworthia glossinidia endosymbiont of Glossina brevipalpis]|uniref:Glycine--tRNA ligase beta subunit n=1 Tax=Wigglesworthia glossinidia brevipalpis TaxID=36870 RepID=Q8D1W2_WIGBR|nr:glyS [Wigglesworthia glossinidia endosymbiont of Glossina brevipalpis]
MKKIFLIEIGTEELPSYCLNKISKSFCESIKKQLFLSKIEYKNIKWLSSSRRLAVQADLYIYKTKNSYILKKGPRIKNEKDIYNINVKMWIKKFGISTKQIKLIKNKKGVWVSYKACNKKYNLFNKLFDIIKSSLEEVYVPKKMKWSNYNFQFIRPVHSITALLDDKIIPGKIFDINIDRNLLGIFYKKRQKIVLNNAVDYENALLKNFNIIVDYKKRKNIINEKIKLEEKKFKGKVLKNDKFLEEITSLVEIPNIISGNFKKSFLKIPVKIIENILCNIQKCFPVYEKNKQNLLPKFIFVINGNKNGVERIIKDNENVINNRLLDVEFFIKIDLQTKLKDRICKLNSIIFHDNLGSLKEKTIRIKLLSICISNKINGNYKYVSRASLLCKCDLTTNMVFEFPTTQGIIGEYYSEINMESKEVSLAQREHYYPRFSKDILPTNLTSQIISIADKLDTIVGIFGIKLYPTGKKDPFCLKRLSLGIIRIIIEKKLSININHIIDKSISLYSFKLTNENLKKEVLEFFLKRLISLYEKKYNPCIIKSVISFKKIPSCLYDLDKKIYNIVYFIEKNDISIILKSYKRIKNILKISNKSSKKNFLLKNNFLNKNDIIELSFKRYFDYFEKKFSNLLIEKNYLKLLILLKQLSKKIDKYLDNIKIFTNNKDIKKYRIKILKKILNFYLYIADFSVLEEYK